MPLLLSLLLFVNMFQEQLKEILGNSIDTQNLYSILHEMHAPKEQTDINKHKSKSRNKFKYVKKSN